MTIRPLQVFDREAPQPGKVLEVPLILTDKAGKTNHASVYVVIGDEVGCRVPFLQCRLLGDPSLLGRGAMDIVCIRAGDLPMGHKRYLRTMINCRGSTRRLVS